MEFVLFNNVAKSDILNFNAAMRAGYLISQKICVFGRIYNFISDWEMIRIQKPSIKRHIMLTQQPEDLLPYLEANYAVLDAYKNQKFLKPDQLQRKIIAENNLKKLETFYIAQRKERDQLLSFSFFQQLVRDGENAVLSLIHAENPDKPFTFGSISSLLKLTCPETTNGPDIAMLDPDFFNPGFGFDIRFAPGLFNLHLPETETYVNFTPLLKFPVIMNLSTTELKYLNREIEAIRISWQNLLDHFVRYYMGKTDEKISNSDLAEIERLSREMELKIAASNILTNDEKPSEDLNRFQLELCLGLMPYSMMCKYYEAQEFLEQKTISYLEAYKTDPEYNMYIPIMAWRSLSPDYTPTSDPEEEAEKIEPDLIKPVKKYLDIGD